MLLTGKTGIDKKTTARYLEKRLFDSGEKAYFLGIANILKGLDADVGKEKRSEHVRRLAELSHILLDSGLIVIATASDLSADEIKLIQEIISKDDLMVITVEEDYLNDNLTTLFLESDKTINENVTRIIDLLKLDGIIFSV